MTPNHTMHRTANRILKSLLADSTGLSLNKYRQWLRNKGSAEAEYERVGTYVSEEDYTTARLIRDSIPDKFGLTGYGYYEYLYYVDYTEIIWGAQEDTIHYSELDSVTVLAVQYIADNSTGLAGALAQGLLNQYYGYNYEVIPQEPGGQQGLMAPPGNSVTQKQQNQQPLIAFPNPAGDFVTFQYNLEKGADNAKLVIFDLDGRQIKMFPLDSERGSVDWETGHLPYGVYYCQIMGLRLVPASIKLVLIK